MATVFVRNPGRRLASIELKTEVERIVERLERSAARVYVPRRDLDYALDVGLRMLLLRHLVEEKDGAYRRARGGAAAAALLCQLDRAPGRRMRVRDEAQV